MLNRTNEDHIIIPGLPDDSFTRLEHVPMTKEEVRMVSLCKLKPSQNGIIYDIGAGTGSVSVECARLCPEGMVYALEQKESACQAIALNQEKFRLHNLEIIHATAPEGFKDLPSPTHVFIGGTGGHLREIYDALAGKMLGKPDDSVNRVVSENLNDMEHSIDLKGQKQTGIRVVLTAVTLETISEMMDLAKEKELEVETTQISVSKAKKLGDYHLMMGQNPVTIFTFTI